jgi:hypothetical protein
LFRNTQDNRQELAILELQLTRDTKQAGFKLEEIAAEANIREIEALHTEFSRRKETYRWIEALISSVRPVITYAFFALYASVKAAQFELALRATGETVIALPAIWHEPDQIIFATVIAFWFGSRTMRHFRKGT